MRFRLSDLFAATAVVAITAALFQVDLVAFRQWLALVLILSGAMAMIAVRIPASRRFRMWGAVGGLLGSGLFLLVTYWLRSAVFDDPSAVFLLEQPRWTADLSTDAWLFHAALVPMVGAICGALLGPVLLIARDWIPLPASCRLAFQVTWALAAAVLLILFFEMLDRLALGMGGRNWMPVRWLASIVLVVHASSWLRRLESSRSPRHSAVSGLQPSHPDQLVS